MGSERQRGALTEDHKRKLAEAAKGRAHSPEVRERIAVSKRLAAQLRKQGERSGYQPPDKAEKASLHNMALLMRRVASGRFETDQETINRVRLQVHAATWYLERRDPRFKPSANHEVTGAGGGPLTAAMIHVPATSLVEAAAIHEDEPPDVIDAEAEAYQLPAELDPENPLQAFTPPEGE